VDCVPIFWLATEDHDVAEISSAALLTPDGDIGSLMTLPRGPEGRPVSDIQLGEDVAALVEQGRTMLGDSDVVQALADAYRRGVTFGDAFARLYSHLFAEFGVLLIDGADPHLHQIASPVYRAAVVGAADINDAQRERDRSLEAGGYHQQVKVTPSSTLLFWLQDGARTPIHRSNRHFVVGEEKLTEAELLQRIAAEPQNFSGNVLLRPVVQDYLLPTLAYVGGPAEVAYFAQAAVIYEQLLGRVTPVLPRLSATIVEPRVQSLLQKYGISVEDVIRHDTRLAELLAARTLPADVAQAFDASSGNLEQSLAALHAILQRLRARAARAQLRRTAEVGRHATRLVNSLYPHHNLQEREIAGISMVARHGAGLLRQIYDHLQPSCPDHQLFYL
jgi:bacillithiol biosynthesis cysteine-adding enzyme BshC